jgi:hypothetical protein
MVLHFMLHNGIKQKNKSLSNFSIFFWFCKCGTNASFDLKEVSFQAAGADNSKRN